MFRPVLKLDRIKDLYLHLFGIISIQRDGKQRCQTKEMKRRRETTDMGKKSHCLHNKSSLLLLREPPLRCLKSPLGSRGYLARLPIMKLVPLSLSSTQITTFRSIIQSISHKQPDRRKIHCEATQVVKWLQLSILLRHCLILW